MPKNLLNNLDFEMNKVVKFKDPSMQLVEAVGKAKEFKRDDILYSMNLLAQQFNSKDVSLGCAIHFKNIDQWGPAIMVPTRSPMKLWSPYDSPGIANAYDGDVIDSIHFVIINYKADKNTKLTYYTPKKNHHLH